MTSNRTYIFLNTETLSSADWQKYNKYALYGTHPRFVNDEVMRFQYLKGARDILKNHPAWQEHFESELFNKKEHRAFCPEYTSNLANFISEIKTKNQNEVFAIITKYNEKLNFDNELVPQLVTAGMPKNIMYDYILPSNDTLKEVQNITDYITNIVKYNDFLIVTNDTTSKYHDTFGENYVIDAKNEGLNADMFLNFNKQFEFESDAGREAQG